MSALLDGVFRRLLARPVQALPSSNETAEPAANRDDPRRPAQGSALLEWIDHEDREQALAVHLLDESTSGFGVRSSVPLDPGWPVLLTIPNSAPMKAVVRHRRRESAGWMLGLQLIRRERRRFDRRPLDRQIQLVWQGTDGRRRIASGRVRDVGEGGLRFVCREEIPLRASVLMEIEGWQRFGTVTHVNPDEEWRSYGVMFTGPPILQQSADFAR